MKFMIAVDCEGVACVVGAPGKSLSRSQNMAFASAQATRETNAAARALFHSGATKVVVWDSHGDGTNLVYDQLDRRCEILLGVGFGSRFPELNASYAGVLMIGYHAMAGAVDGVLAHTYSSAAYRSIKVCGVEVGEIALDSAVAGEFGVPLIFLSSDYRGCEEARKFMPWVATVETKRGLGLNCAASKHPQLVEQEIGEAVRLAVEQLALKKVFAFQQPIEIEIEFETFANFIKAWIRRSGWKVVGLKRLKKSLLSMLEWQC